MKNQVSKKSKTSQDKIRDYVQSLFSDPLSEGSDAGEPSQKQEKIHRTKSKTKIQIDGEDLDMARDKNSDLFVPAYLIEEEGDLDLTKVFARSIDPNTGVPRDVKIPDGDFPEAKNYWDFVSNFVGPETRFPFARQAWIMLMLFGEICPNKKCTNPKWLDITNVPVDYDARELPAEMTFFHNGVCPKCKGTKSYFVERQRLTSYVECNLAIGQRAGKSTTVASGGAYVTHKYLKLPKLSSICRGIQSSTVLTATFVGYRYTDAADLLWAPILNVIEESPWFQKLHEMLDYVGKKHGAEILRKKDSYLRYAHKNLELYPAGPSKRGLRGRTRFLAGVDEIGWFPEDDNGDRERAGAEEVYNALDRSLLTVRTEIDTLFQQGYNNFLPGLAINLSSPSSQTDMIMRLVEKSKTRGNALGLNLATWEVSPLYSRNSTAIVEAYKDNPVFAERDYGANPPLNSSIFIDTNEQAVKDCFAGKQRAGIKLLKKVSPSGLKMIGGTINWTVPLIPTPPSVLTIDAGYSNNSFAVVVMHPLKSRIVVDACIEIPPLDKCKLAYNQIYVNVIEPLIKQFNCKFFFADRWNSLSMLHRAEEELGIKALQYSVKYHDFVLTRSYLQERQIILPPLELPHEEIRSVIDYRKAFLTSPVSHLFHQMQTVKDHGSTVVKGDTFTDDIFRALVLGVSRVCDPKVKEALEQFAALQARVSGNRIGAVVSTSMGGIQNVSLPRGVSHNEDQSRIVAIQYSGTNPRGPLVHGRNGVSSHVVRVSRSFGN